MGFSANLTITDVGRAALANASIGDTLVFTRFAIGQGYMSGSQTEAGMTTLVDYQFNINLSDSTESGGTVTLVGVLNPASLMSDLIMREMGVMANLTHGGVTTEVLIAYGNAAGNADTIRTTDTIVRTITIQFPFSSAATIVSNYDPSSVILRSEYATDQAAQDGRITALEAAIQNVGTPTYNSIFEFLANAKEGEEANISYNGGIGDTISSLKITALFNDAGSGVTINSGTQFKLCVDTIAVIKSSSTYHFVDIADVIAGSTTEATATLSTINANYAFGLWDKVDKVMRYFASKDGTSTPGITMLLDGASANNGQAVTLDFNGLSGDLVVGDSFVFPIFQTMSGYLYAVTSCHYDDSTITLYLYGELLASSPLNSLFPNLTGAYSIYSSDIMSCSFLAFTGQPTLAIFDVSGGGTMEGYGLCPDTGYSTFTVSGIPNISSGTNYVVPVQFSKGACVYLSINESGSRQGAILPYCKGITYISAYPFGYMDGVGGTRFSAHSFGVYCDMYDGQQVYWSPGGYIPGTYDVGSTLNVKGSNSYFLCGSIGMAYKSTTSITAYDRYYSDCRVLRLVKWNGKPYAVMG